MKITKSFAVCKWRSQFFVFRMMYGGKTISDPSKATLTAEKGSSKLPDHYLKGSSQGLKVANFLQEGSTADRTELDLTASLCSRDLGFGA